MFLCWAMFDNVVWRRYSNYLWHLSKLRCGKYPKMEPVYFHSQELRSSGGKGLVELGIFDTNKSERCLRGTRARNMCEKCIQLRRVRYASLHHSDTLRFTAALRILVQFGEKSHTFSQHRYANTHLSWKSTEKIVPIVNQNTNIKTQQ